jgi:hypothetical protein
MKDTIFKKWMVILLITLLHFNNGIQGMMDKNLLNKESITNEVVEILANMEKDALYNTIQALHQERIKSTVAQQPILNDEVKKNIVFPGFFLRSLVLTLPPVLT